jgi:hypothetical protein
MVALFLPIVLRFVKPVIVRLELLADLVTLALDRFAIVLSSIASISGACRSKSVEELVRNSVSSVVDSNVEGRASRSIFSTSSRHSSSSRKSGQVKMSICLTGTFRTSG